MQPLNIRVHNHVFSWPTFSFTGNFGYVLGKVSSWLRQPDLSTMFKNLTNRYNQLEIVHRYKNREIDKTPAGGRQRYRFSPKSETEDSVESKNLKP